MILKKVVWMGETKELVSGLPIAIREDLGFQLYQLQQGKLPIKSRPMKSIGSNVFELKEQDHQAWYRVIYTLQVKGKIFVLHCFKKQSAKTSKGDLELARSRLKQIY